MSRRIAICVLVASAVARTASGQALTFTRDDYAAFGGARAVASADFDRDGRPDLALANGESNTVSVLLNRPATGLTRIGDVAVGTGPFDIVSDDFNRDAIADLAVANADSHRISILIGRGDGTFSRADDLPAFLESPRGIATGDMNNDGTVDLICSGYADGLVQVLIGGGRGTFTRGPSAALTPALRPQGLDTGDFNQDGHLDIAVATAAGLQILYGNGGTALTARAIGGATDLNVIAVADINQDGWTDVAAASTPTGAVALYLGGATGFARGRSYRTGGSPRGITAADLNQDGFPDVITANRGTSTVSVLLGDHMHPGVLLADQELAAGAGSRDVVAGDFDGDGRTDLATGNEYAAVATVLSNTTPFSRAAFSFRAMTMRTGVAAARPVAAADFDRDGRLDMVLENGNGSILVLTWRATVALPQPFPGAVTGVADVNADGHPDILYRGYERDDPSVSTRTRLMTFLGDGDGGFVPSQTTVLPLELWECASGDMDRNGRADLVCGGYDLHKRAQVLQVLPGAGDGRFDAGIQVALPDVGADVGALQIADVNRDGAPDVVVLRGNLEVWRGNGAGGLSPEGIADLRNMQWPRFLTLGDLNLDGRIDVVVVSNYGDLAIALGGANGLDDAAVTPAFADGPPQIVDVNRDGQPDIVVASYPNERRHQGEDINIADLPPDAVLVLSGRGDGTFAPADAFAIAGSFIGVADLTRDGLADIAGWDGNDITVLVGERNDVNHPPVVTAVNRTVNYNDLVVDPLGPFECAFLSAEAADPDQHAVSYEWRDAAGALVTTNRVMRRCDQRPGVYPMQLTVRDGRGAVVVRPVVLTIQPSKEIVVYATNSTGDDDVWLAGRWTPMSDPPAAGGLRAWDPDAGRPKVIAPAAHPADSVRIRFTPDPTQAYKLWVRLKADRNDPGNDSIFVQFSGATDEAGRPVYRIGTASGLAINLEECAGCGVSGWGWEDDGWGAVDRNGARLRFPDGGRQDILIQTREDGVSIDQIVLSSEKYLTARPGLAKNDHTILARNYHQNPH